MQFSCILRGCFFANMSTTVSKLMSVSWWIWIKASEPSLSWPILALIHECNLRKTLALRSHSHDVTGNVQANCSRTAMFWKSLTSMSFIAAAHVDGRLSGGIFMYRILYLISSVGSNSCDGSKFLYTSAASETAGTRPSNVTAFEFVENTEDT